MKQRFGDNLYEIDGPPDKCPYCHHAIEPVHVQGVEGNNLVSPAYALQSALRCPRHRCGRLFIASYGRSSSPGMGAKYSLKLVGPRTFQTPEVSDEIASVSPDYPEIKGQSAEAEDRGLNQIAGPGYRKALEFLIKDYCRSLYDKGSEDYEKIGTAHLGPVIENYVAGENVKQCARLASWLGNDEVHYFRRWTDKDISDLKTLLRLTEDWIEAEILTARYKGDMSGSGNG